MIDWSIISLQDLAGFLSEELRKKGIDTILVGGACVTIYSKNRYQSYDLDYVTYEDLKTVRKALRELGFIEICLEQDINFDEVEKWSLKEKQVDKFQLFKDLFHQKKANLNPS